MDVLHPSLPWFSRKKKEKKMPVWRLRTDQRKPETILGGRLQFSHAPTSPSEYLCRHSTEPHFSVTGSKPFSQSRPIMITTYRGSKEPKTCPVEHPLHDTLGTFQCGQWIHLMPCAQTPCVSCHSATYFPRGLNGSFAYYQRAFEVRRPQPASDKGSGKVLQTGNLGRYPTLALLAS